MGPGQGPQTAYRETDWQYWWYLNEVPLLRLRERLLDQPDFQRVLQADRDRAIVSLLEAARDTQPGVRSQALMALAKSGADQASSVLLAALEDSSLEVRLQAVLGLGVRGHPGALPSLERILDSKTWEPKARGYAAISLGLVTGPETRDVFLRVLAPEAFHALPTEVQQGVAIGVGLSEDRELCATIQVLLEGGKRLRSAVRAQVVLALGRLRNTSYRETLIEYLSDEDVHVRRSAALGLGVLMEHSGDPSSIRAILEQLRPDRKNNESEAVARNFLYVALGRIGGDASRRYLLRETAGSNRGSVNPLRTFKTIPLSQISREPFTALALGLTRADDRQVAGWLARRFQKTGSQPLQGALALAMGLYGDDSVVSVLRKSFTKARNPFLRGTIGLALGMLGDEKAARRLLEHLAKEKDRELLPRMATSLALLGRSQDATKVLVKRLAKNGSLELRQTLLYCLGLVGQAETVPVVQKILHDPREPAGVRSYAAVALGDLLDRSHLPTLARMRENFNYASAPNLLLDLLVTL